MTERLLQLYSPQHMNVTLLGEPAERTKQLLDMAELFEAPVHKEEVPGSVGEPKKVVVYSASNEENDVYIQGEPHDPVTLVCFDNLHTPEQGIRWAATHLYAHMNGQPFGDLHLEFGSRDDPPQERGIFIALGQPGNNLSNIMAILALCDFTTPAARAQLGTIVGAAQIEPFLDAWDEATECWTPAGAQFLLKHADLFRQQ